MADDVEMIPVEAAEPPKANPLSASAAPKVATIKLSPITRSSVVGSGATAALKPGLKLPPKSGIAAGLKLPPKPGMAAGLKLPPKPGMAAGLKLPTVAMKPGLRMPVKPMIRKPGATAAAAPLPKPVVPPTSANPVSMEALKAVTQKLKGITQEIPQQAILHKTGIIAEGEMSEAQKEAAKHKTARISLSDALGVAPVKDENAPMKTIRIKRPIDIPMASKTEDSPALTAEVPAALASTEATPAIADQRPTTPTVTQRKTLKIARPGGAVRPAGKFGVKRPGQATPIAKPLPAATKAPEAPASSGEASVADIPEMPAAAPVPMPAAPMSDVPSWVLTLSMLVQVAACVAIGALAWFLYQNTQTSYF